MFKKRSKTKNFNFSEGNTLLSKKPVWVAANAWKLPTIRNLHNIRFGRLVFEVSQKDSQNSQKIKDLTIPRAITLSVNKTWV